MLDTTRREEERWKAFTTAILRENSIDLDLCLQTANQMLVENSKTKVKPIIDVGKADISHIRDVVPLMQSITNVERKAIMQ